MDDATADDGRADDGRADDGRVDADRADDGKDDLPPCDRVAPGDTLDARLAATIAPTLEGMGYELVRVTVLGRERPTVQVMADRADGTQIGVGDCEAISGALGAVLDVEDPLPGAWQLEVSSAGIDRPLTRVKDWNRFSGHLAKVEMTMPVEGRRRFSGTVLGADDEAATLRLEDGSDVRLPLAALRRAKLVLTDALIDATAGPTPPN